MTPALIIACTVLGVLYIFGTLHARNKADAVEEAAWGRKQALWELRAIALHRPSHIVDEPAGRRDQVVSEHTWR